MNTRIFLSLVVLALFGACASRSGDPPVVVPDGGPEVVIHGTLEQVRLSIITQQKGEGMTLASQSARRLSFVTQVRDPLRNVLDEMKPTGAPFVRATYRLIPEARGTRVLLSSEIVENYGTAAEQARPFDPPEVRQTGQRNLRRVQANVEKGPAGERD